MDAQHSLKNLHKKAIVSWAICAGRHLDKKCNCTVTFKQSSELQDNVTVHISGGVLGDLVIRTPASYPWNTGSNPNGGMKF